MNPKAYEFASEFYVVEKTVEVVVNLRGKGSQFIRIDALRADTGNYSTRSQLLWNGLIQAEFELTTPAAPNGADSVAFWVNYDLPWTSRDTADGAIEQALSFLQERCEK